MKNRSYGIILTLFLTSVIILVLFRGVLKSPNTTYFATDGDGFKAYYGALYHARYDSLPFRTYSMNYPFGEVITFTDSQPLLVNGIRFISAHIADITPYTVGIINLMMLLSVILGALFIYLLFREAGTAWWYASPVATGIALLSPQIARMGGHFSLSWVFWIPLMIWLIVRFDKTRRLHFALIIGFVTYLAGLMHFYYVAFFGFLLGGYWFFRFFWYRKAGTSWYRDLLYIFIQFIVPVLLLQFFVLINDDVTDRPSWPFGFWSNLAHPVALFFPSGPPWSFVPRVLTVFRHISWESWAFIGTPATIGTIAGLVFMIRRMFMKESFHRISHIGIINILFWVAVFSLFFAVGIPFILGLKSLVAYLEPLRQLRALGRFSWIYFYMINLVVFVFLYRKAFVPEAGKRWKILAVAAVLLLLTEGVFHSAKVASSVNNRIPGMDQPSANRVGDDWLKRIDPSEYQAVIPLPYFHVGSENIWIEGGYRVKETAMMVSLKTGLPTTGVMLSRTSISQTYINYALHTEPLERLEFPDYLPDERPFLLLLMNGYTPTVSESIMLRDAALIAGTPHFSLFRLTVANLRRLNLAYLDQVTSRYQESELTFHGGYRVTDERAFFVLESFDTTGTGNAFHGNGTFEFTSGAKFSLWNGAVGPLAIDSVLMVSMWVRDYKRDAFLRSVLEVAVSDKETGNHIKNFRFDFFSNVKAFRGDWALVEFPVGVPDNECILKLSVENKVLHRALLAVDELMLREAGLDVFRTSGQWLEMNNRRVPLRQSGQL